MKTLQVVVKRGALNIENCTDLMWKRINIIVLVCAKCSVYLANESYYSEESFFGSIGSS